MRLGLPRGSGLSGLPCDSRERGLAVMGTMGAMPVHQPTRSLDRQRWLEQQYYSTAQLATGSGVHHSDVSVGPLLPPPPPPRTGLLLTTWHHCLGGSHTTHPPTHPLKHSPAPGVRGCHALLPPPPPSLLC